MTNFDQDPEHISHMVLYDLVAEVLKLRAAIRSHRDQKGDDRCWMDDVELYKNLPEGVVDADFSLLSDEQFRRNCDVYIQNRKCPVLPGAVIGQYVMDRLRDRVGQNVVVLATTTDRSGVGAGLLQMVQDFSSITVFDFRSQTPVTLSFIEPFYSIRKILSREGDILYENTAIPRNYGNAKTPEEIADLRTRSFGKKIAERI